MTPCQLKVMISIAVVIALSLCTSYVLMSEFVVIKKKVAASRATTGDDDAPVMKTCKIKKDMFN
jgi:hypothetical protein